MGWVTARRGWDKDPPELYLCSCCLLLRLFPFLSPGRGQLSLSAWVWSYRALWETAGVKETCPREMQGDGTGVLGFGVRRHQSSHWLQRWRPDHRKDGRPAQVLKVHVLPLLALYDACSFIVICWSRWNLLWTQCHYRTSLVNSKKNAFTFIFCPSFGFIKLGFILKMSSLEILLSFTVWTLPCQNIYGLLLKAIKAYYRELKSKSPIQ